MSSLNVVERYTATLFEVAKEKKLIEKIKDDLGKLDDSFEKSKDLKLFFELKSIPAIEKKDLLLKILNGLEVNEYTQNYFKLYLENSRFNYTIPHLSYITFNNLYKKSMGIKQGVLYLSKPLSPDEAKLLTQKIGDKLGFKLELEVKVDSTLIDGSYLEIDGMVYEDNLKMRLANLKNWMKV
ncbi:MAG: ATP synthase F1 subunit delta [Firmicutes bacterium]|nr:ATP synthase F1 subunit delta [Bacillota bacterium]